MIRQLMQEHKSFYGNIWAVGIGYDGETTVKGLKSVIDDMVKNAKLAMKSLKSIETRKKQLYFLQKIIYNSFSWQPAIF